MADAIPGTGRLIAVEGTRGADVTDEALALAERLRRRGVSCGISRWDASGLFGDLLLSDDQPILVAPRMLALIFAADLVFRIQWEIQPGLTEGRVMIAAPYVHSATAVAVGLGLDPAWVVDVLRFAPSPDMVRLARERKRARAWRPRPGRGYGEFCAAVLDEAPGSATKRRARRAAIEWLEAAVPDAAPRRRAVIEFVAGVLAPATRLATTEEPTG